MSFRLSVILAPQYPSGGTNTNHSAFPKLSYKNPALPMLKIPCNCNPNYVLDDDPRRFSLFYFAKFEKRDAWIVGWRSKSGSSRLEEKQMSIGLNIRRALAATCL
jgi:hypothetical protein